MKDSIVKLKLIDGEPVIGKLEVIDDSVVMEVLIPGVLDEAITIEADDDYFHLELDEDYPYTDHFSFELNGESLVFKEFDLWKEAGVLHVIIPVLREVKNDNQSIRYKV